MNIIIIGGGKASLTLIDYFLSADDIRVVGIADIKEDAPGILRARELKIETSTRMEDLIQVVRHFKFFGTIGVEQRDLGEFGITNYC